MKCTSNSSTLIEFGQLLRTWRKSSGTSQAELARAIGVTQASMSRIETGDQDCGVAHAFQVVNFLLNKKPGMDRSTPIIEKDCPHCGQFMSKELQEKRRLAAKRKQSRSQKAAIEKRRSNGLYVGRPPKTPYTEAEVVDLRSQGNSYTVIALKLGISKLTVQKICKRLGIKVRTTTSMPRTSKPKKPEVDGHRPWLEFEGVE